TGERGDAWETVPDGVAMEEHLSRDGVRAAVVAQVRLERVDEILVLGVFQKRPEEPLREQLDVARGLIEHEAEGAELVEVDRASVAVQTGAERDRVLGLDQGEVRARGAVLRSP